MTLPSGATAWAATGSDTAGDVLGLRDGGERGHDVLDPGARSRNDSPSGAATTTRALDGASPSCACELLLGPDARGLVAQPLGDERLRAVGLGPRDGERVREVAAPTTTAPNAAAASTSSHATSTIQRWR